MNEVKNNIFCNDLHCFFVEPTKPSFVFSEDDLFPIIAGPKRSKTVENLLRQIKSQWDPSMNLYFKNCQHFSGFAARVFAESKK